MGTPKLIFDVSDWDRLQAAKRLLHDLLPKIDKLQACGVECEGYKAIRDEALNTLTKIEQNYFQEFAK